MNRSWQAPSQESDSSYKLGYINEICQDGMLWNESQPGHKDWRRSIEILNGSENEKDNEFLTYASGRRLRTNVRTAVAGLSNIRPIWGWNAADPAFESYAGMYNKTSRALFMEGYWGQDIKDGLCYAMATDTGFYRPVYRRGMHGMGKGKICIFTYGQPCVLPFQMPASGDYQEAYAVTLMDEYPIAEAHSRWPLFQDRLKPTKSALWYSSEIRSSAKKNGIKRLFGNWWSQGDHPHKGTDLYIPIRYTTIIDPSINDSSTPRAMGQPGTPWYYVVPPYDPKLKNHDAARLYPFRRLIITSEDVELYDGPAFNWHAQLDLIPITVDRWPWAPGGFSMVHDGYNIQKNIDRLERGSLDRQRAQANLALAYDINAVNPSEAAAFDPLDRNNNRIGYDGEMTDMPFKFPLPMEWYHIRAEIFQMLERLDNELDYTMQLRDLVELSKARIAGKDAQDIEKWLSSLGPIVKEISHGMEKPLSQLANQVGWLITEYMTSSQIMSYIGAESMAPETFDYEPSKVLPSHLPDEMVHGADGMMIPSQYSEWQRAKFIHGKIKFITTPGSVHELQQMTMTLILMQMKQRGMAISDYTTMKSAGVPDIGNPPEGNSESERYWSERMDKVTHEARIAAFTMLTGTEQHLTPPGGGAAAPKPNGSTHRGGRPPTAQVTPHMETKGDGRTTISESQ
jgi:hypothetical protein